MCECVRTRCHCSVPYGPQNIPMSRTPILHWHHGVHPTACVSLVAVSKPTIGGLMDVALTCYSRGVGQSVAKCLDGGYQSTGRQTCARTRILVQSLPVTRR